MQRIIKLESYLVFCNLPLFSRQSRVKVVKGCALLAPLILLPLQIARTMKGAPLDWKFSLVGTGIALIAVAFVTWENFVSKASSQMSAIEVERSVVPAVYVLGVLAAVAVLLVRLW
jgi:hypothetical protein